MFNLLKTILNINSALAERIKGEQLFEEAMGLCDVKEYKKAFPLMAESAEKGSAFGILHLGMMYMQGQGVECNWVKAAQQFSQSIELHKESGRDRIALDAITNLGLIYGVGGYGLKRDLVRAKSLLERAVAEGDQAAEAPLQMLNNKSGIFGQKEKSRPPIQWGK